MNRPRLSPELRAEAQAWLEQERKERKRLGEALARALDKACEENL